MTTPKYCDQCHHLFLPENGGLRAVFCKSCYVACEQGYLQIRRYLQEHPGASTAKVAIETGVPTAYVYHLFRLGRFGAMGNPISHTSSGSTPEQRGVCVECGKTLSVYFNALCEACDLEIPQAKPTEGVASAFHGARRNPPRRRREKQQYGFNRFR